ncbi:MAG: hypothetical protein IJ228_01245 [Succinivibrio sp.]|nr:hypothetical protein [Succinivibrio sp.]
MTVRIVMPDLKVSEDHLAGSSAATISEFRAQLKSQRQGILRRCLERAVACLRRSAPDCGLQTAALG